MVKWVAREVKKEDLRGLEQLTTIIYGHMWKRSGNSMYYNWKLYGGNRPEPNGQVARKNQLIVGYQASCHRLFRFGSYTCWSTELGDSMVHPEGRRQGVWEGITSQIINNALELKYLPVYGFPNQYSYQGYKKKLSMECLFYLWRLGLPLKPEVGMLEERLPGWFERFEGCIPGWLMKLGFIMLLAFRNISQKTMYCFSSPLIVERIYKIEDWCNDLWEEEKRHDEAGVVKNVQYLHWRFDENPDHYMIYKASDAGGKPLGLLVTKIRDMGAGKVFGFIADIVIPSRKRSVLYYMLHKAELDFKKEGVILVDAYCTLHPFYLKGLIAYGFLPVGRIPFIVPMQQANDLRNKGWGNSKRWVLTLADSDNV